MNDKFFELPEEKQLKIINAGFEVFAQNDYRHASTEELALKAGISKGLLFYYFHDKRSLYMFLFEHAASMIKQFVLDEHLQEITDFFELCAYASERKCQLLHKSPYIMDFVVRGFFSKHETITDDINKRVESETEKLFTTYFAKINFSKFKNSVNPRDIFDMLTWMTDGYVHEKQRSGLPIDLDDVMAKFRLWSEYLKQISYKEEFLT